MSRYLFVHGHFYQPPRENPWLEEIELQDSARPYRNWNERITSECYAPNAASRIHDDKGQILDVVNNYSRISFNFGPTLLSWLERFEPEVYLAILKADKSAQQYFSGHGSAIAQAYNHMIMPLANERDKRTQVLWGIRDFVARFKRQPEGMWLPETAVDIDSLEALAAQGIRFTILAPYQAKRIRKIGRADWEEIEHGAFDIQRPYRCALPSGKSMILFFYDGPVSHDIAFGGLLNSGSEFARRLIELFHEEKPDHFACCATDGETFGHHHRFGDMALAYCLHYIEKNRLASLCVPGQLCELLPLEYEVEIVENSSWSCAHGIERWRADCGCRVGTQSGWNQKWRAPLRQALDWLRDQLIVIFEKQMQPCCQDPWSVRDEYIEVVLDRSEENIQAFLVRHCSNHLSVQDKIKILKLLEMQRQSMLMFTSCGWFFDEISGIESRQILLYAARAIQLAFETAGIELEEGLLKILAKAPSNQKQWRNGAHLYREQIKSSAKDLLSIGAHFAISSLFEKYPPSARIYAYEVETHDDQLYEKENRKMAFGKAHIKSTITLETQKIDFAVVLFDDYNLHGCVRPFIDEKSFAHMHAHLKKQFFKTDISQVVDQMSQHFSGRGYSLRDLLKNEQAHVLQQIFDNTLESVDTHFREIYRHFYPLMQINPEFHIPVPKVLALTVEFVLNQDLIDILQATKLNLQKLQRIVTEIKRWPFMRDNKTVEYEAKRKIESMMQEFARYPEQKTRLHQLCQILRILKPLKLELDLWKSQNLYFLISRTTPAKTQTSTGALSTDDRAWHKEFQELGRHLKLPKH